MLQWSRISNRDLNVFLYIFRTGLMQERNGKIETNILVTSFKEISIATKPWRGCNKNPKIALRCNVPRLRAPKGKDRTEENETLAIE